MIGKRFRLVTDTQIGKESSMRILLTFVIETISEAQPPLLLIVALWLLREML